MVEVLCGSCFSSSLAWPKQPKPKALNFSATIFAKAMLDKKFKFDWLSEIERLAERALLSF